MNSAWRKDRASRCEAKIVRIARTGAYHIVRPANPKGRESRVVCSGIIRRVADQVKFQIIGLAPVRPDLLLANSCPAAPLRGVLARWPLVRSLYARAATYAAKQELCLILSDLKGPACFSEEHLEPYSGSLKDLDRMKYVRDG